MGWIMSKNKKEEDSKDTSYESARETNGSMDVERQDLEEGHKVYEINDPKKLYLSQEGPDELSLKKSRSFLNMQKPGAKSKVSTKSSLKGSDGSQLIKSHIKAISNKGGLTSHCEVGITSKGSFAGGQNYEKAINGSYEEDSCGNPDRMSAFDSDYGNFNPNLRKETDRSRSRSRGKSPQDRFKGYFNPLKLPKGGSHSNL